MLEQTLLPSRLLCPHAHFSVCGLCVLAYTQLLEAYRSSTGKLSRRHLVQWGFIDSKLSQFITSAGSTRELTRSTGSSRRHSRVLEQYEQVECGLTSTVPATSLTTCSVVKKGALFLNEVQRSSKHWH
ncbi:hypothetical protein BKA70DRAFT_1300496 [Coprinopsis sp. MPI-PUGE-AT-0042]|nr:hypothetical protein BKA70DRAFT_1300496 [Coprinopsis sp. MPI-PUGE-AT-0042]